MGEGEGEAMVKGTEIQNLEHLQTCYTQKNYNYE